jgi:hypothetical protein
MSDNFQTPGTSDFSREYVEADWFAGDPDYEVFERGRRKQEEMLAPRMGPMVFPRTESAEAEARLLEMLAQKLGVEKEYDALRQARHLEADQVAAILDRERPMPTDFAFEPMEQERTEAIGEMWWARHDWTWLPDIIVAPSGGEFHITNDVEYNNGDLWQGNILQFFSTYGLSPDRMPPVGGYESVPEYWFYAYLIGVTGSHSGDNWSKCWVSTYQTVRGGPSQGIITQSSDSRRVLNVTQDNSSAKFNLNDLPGRYPRAQFYLTQDLRRHPLTIVNEIRFGVQLEGRAITRFDSPPVLLRMYQWNLNRVY